jgi:hypothetical protein
MTPENQKVVLEEINSIQKHITWRKQLEQHPLMQIHSGRPTVTNGDHNYYASPLYTLPRRYGSSSSSDGSVPNPNWAHETTGTGNGNEVISRKRVRESADIEGEDGIRFDTKSPRFTPSPRPFNNTSISGSPDTNGYLQNE